MSVADTFVDTVTSGPVLLALPVAAAAGLVSFLSPCVLPLVPGYLSYMTGLSGAELGDTRGLEGDTLVKTKVRRGRVLAGSVLFVLGFSAVFVTTGALFGGLGGALVAHKQVVDRVLGALTVLLGLSFLGLVPGMQRELRFHTLPDAGLAGAPLLGVLFGVGWTPCLGPTLGAVQTLAYTQASAGRGALLTAGYCLGLGLPFIATGLAMRRALGAFDVVKRHYGLVMKVGGGLLVVVGLLLVSGLWARIVLQMQVLVSGFETVV
ncbi:MAG: putative cytochrome biosis rane protein [Frankiales bacterium]|nr:putative cytochrome biosis rane protein [Frankiales bacterium]